MFDEFQFDKGFKELPENLPKDGWQTKDLECELSLFCVLADGRIVRKGTRVTNDEKTYYFSKQLSGYLCLYNHDHDITLLAENGFVIKVSLGHNDEPNGELNWQPFEIPKT